MHLLILNPMKAILRFWWMKDILSNENSKAALMNGASFKGFVLLRNKEKNKNKIKTLIFSLAVWEKLEFILELFSWPREWKTFTVKFTAICLHLYSNAGVCWSQFKWIHFLKWGSVERLWANNILLVADSFQNTFSLEKSV